MSPRQGENRKINAGRGGCFGDSVPRLKKWRGALVYMVEVQLKPDALFSFRQRIQSKENQAITGIADRL